MTNIAKILKDAPKGLKLHCTMVGECEFSYTNGKEIVIKYNKKDETLAALTLDEFGRFSENGDCVLFPTSSDLYWENWQYALFSNNNYGIVVVDKVIGCRYLVVDKDEYKFALCDVFGNISTTINASNLIFVDNDTAFSFFEQLNSNGFEYKNGKIIPIEKICKPEKANCNDYKKIIEHYGVRQQLKKLSEEIYELQEAVIEYGLMPCEENKGNVVEELADVFVLLFQLQEFYEISKYELSDMVVYKVKRTLERIKNEE